MRDIDKLNKDISLLKNKYNEELYVADIEEYHQIGNDIFRLVRDEIAPELTWYAVDLQVEENSEILLIVYDMLDMMGGIGDEVACLRYNYSENEKVVNMIYSYIERRKHKVAERKYKAIQKKKELKAIKNIQKDLF